jgi:hypothetical protein
MTAADAGNVARLVAAEDALDAVLALSGHLLSREEAAALEAAEAVVYFVRTRLERGNAK